VIGVIAKAWTAGLRRAAASERGRELFTHVVLPYLVQRFFVACTVLVALQFFPQRRGSRPLPHLAGLDIWLRWDADFYLSIAQVGYDPQTPTDASAFFPLYPALSALVGLVLPLPIAAWLVANLAALGFLILLHELVRRTDSLELARRSVLVAILFPTSFFLSAGYAESTYLAFCVATVLAVTAGRRGWATLWVFLACLARPQGFLCLTLPFAACWLAQDRKLASLPWFVAGSIPALGAIMGMHYFWSGDPLGFLHGRPLGSLGAFSGAPAVRSSAWRVLLDDGFSSTLMRRLLNWSALVLAVAASAHLIKRRDFTLAVLTVLALALPLYLHKSLMDAASMARYALLAFPIFIVIARWTLRSPLAWVYDAGFAMLQAVLFALFAGWYWAE